MEEDEIRNKAKNFKVNVIVPVYNAAPYLRQCLDSLVAQTHRGLIIYCIDDGSTDGSGMMLDEYRDRHKGKICVEHLGKNMGTAYVRNFAHRLTGKAEFTCIVDADDWLAPDTIEQAMLVAARHTGTDFILFDLIKTYGDREEHYDMPHFDNLTGKEALRLSLDWQIHGLGMISDSLYRNVNNDETLGIYSDEVSTRETFALSRNVRKCQGRYYYRQHEGSVTHKLNCKRFDILKSDRALKGLVEKYADADTVTKLENIRWLRVVEYYMLLYKNRRRLDSSSREYALNSLRGAWLSIDRSCIDRKLRRKPGYMPMPKWWLFALEEDIYFTLRAMTGR